MCTESGPACALEAGRVAASRFEPPFTFTVGEGWANDRGFADGGGISTPKGALVWATGIRASEAMDAPAIGDVDAIVEHIMSLEGATVGEPSKTTVGGREATALDVTTGSGDFSGLFYIAADAFNLSPGEKARFVIVDHPAGPVVFVLESYAEADFEAWLETAQPVLDSVTWE